MPAAPPAATLRAEPLALEEPLVARLTSLLLLLLSVLVALPASAAQEREPLDVRIFTKVPSPGQPEGIIVDTDATVYVGTHNYGNGDAEAPSKIFAYAPDGTLKREYVVQGQNLEEDHGILAFAFDAARLLYVLDRNPARVFTLDPRTGEQRDYATFRDVPPCSRAPDKDDCSAGPLDLSEFPDYPVFAPDGTMYVTDLEQGLIWRVPNGGGRAEVWFTDARLESVFGPNGIQFVDDGKTLLFAQTGSTPPGATDAGTGKLYTLPVKADGSAGELRVLWEGRPLDGPDGFAIAESGNVYVALAGANQLLKLSPQGEELARVPATPVHNQTQEVPFDTPASVAFLGERVLVTNQSFFTGTSEHWVVFDVFAGEQGLPLFRPEIRAAGADVPDSAPNAPGDPAHAAPPAGTGQLPATGAGSVLTALTAIALAALLARSLLWTTSRWSR